MSDIKIEMTMRDSVGGLQVGYVQGNLIVQLPGEPPPLLPIPPSEKLFGRGELCGQVNNALDNDGRALLHGVGGIGKTAVAATVARDWLAAGKCTGVLWLRVGKAALEGILNGVGSAFGADGGRMMAAAVSLDDKLGVARGLIGQARPLLVLDDCWDASALATLLGQGIPPGTPVLLTSRTHFSLKPAFDTHRLARSDALDLLSHHAGREFSPRPEGEEGNQGLHGVRVKQADDLCELLGDHPYAVEIAGAWLADESLTIPQLRRRIEEAPHRTEIPEGFAEMGRESVAKLFAASVEALDEEARAAFWAMGTLFAPRATPELLAVILAIENAIRTGQTEISIDDEAIEKAHEALQTLARRSLARYLPAEQYCAAYYETHDLVYAYAGEKATDEERERALQACVAYAHSHAHQPNTPEGVAHHNALQAELPNLLEAAVWAAEKGQHGAVNQLGLDLYGNSGFLSVRGKAAEALGLLPLAVAAAEKKSDWRNQALHLGNLGHVYNELGRVENEAIGCYEKALELARSYNQRLIESTCLVGLGECYFKLVDIPRSIEHLDLALEIAREIGDHELEISALSILGLCYRRSGGKKYTQRAVDCYEQALSIMGRGAANESQRASVLSNLGSCYKNLGEFDKAINRYQYALTIAQEGRNRPEQARALYRLGGVLLAQGKWDNAREVCRQSVQIADEIELVHAQSTALWVLARTYLYPDEGDLSMAREFIEEAQQYNDRVPQNKHTILGCLGIVALRQGDCSVARTAFSKAIACADELLVAQQERDALQSKGLAQCGLVLCGGHEYLSAAKETLHKANEASNLKGVIKTFLRSFDELAIADNEGVLKGAHEVAAQPTNYQNDVT